MPLSCPVLAPVAELLNAAEEEPKPELLPIGTARPVVDEELVPAVTAAAVIGVEVLVEDRLRAGEVTAAEEKAPAKAIDEDGRTPVAACAAD